MRSAKVRLSDGAACILDARALVRVFVRPADPDDCQRDAPAGKLVAPDDAARRASAYERVLRLTDLTIQTRVRWGARRELLRWRDLAAALYVQPATDAMEHEAAVRCLLRFTPEASRQLTL